MTMRDIKELTPEELGLILKEWGFPVFHARQIFAWMYKKGAADFDGMSDLPRNLRERLKESYYCFGFKTVTALNSYDGTAKFLFQLKDAGLVEAVAIPEASRVTACLSSQVGCRFACKFCASGLKGFKRNLACGEILEELCRLKNSSPGNRITHVVFMGTGEPLDNYDNVLRAIRAINSEDGFRIGARRITISTSGIPPAIEKLSGENLQIELSVSLHAASDEIRSRLMPINRKYPLAELLKACREYARTTDRQVTFEYILIKGVNSDLPSARKLSTIVKGLNSKVNLIVCNPVKELGVLPPNKLEVLMFKNELVKSGVHVTLRKSRGQDIEAACGQLRLRYAKE
jgi:23S rRNA (adenine2503-C2)-methyltransferase